jgi:hypothetical protein
VPRVVVCIKSGHAVISGANFGSKVGETIWIKKKKTSFATANLGSAAVDS